MIHAGFAISKGRYILSVDSKGVLGRRLKERIRIMVIAVDFDGTIVEHKFPKIGKEIAGACKTINDLQAAGHKIILWTCRGQGDELNQAIEWLLDRGVFVDAVNRNVEEWAFLSSPKIYADVYIDNRAGFRSWESVRRQFKI
jgi:hypothetical protein